MLKRKFGWIGIILLFIILPVKAFRCCDQPFVNSTLIGITPSLLGPAGVFFLVLSSSRLLSRLTHLHLALIVGAISFGLEFAELLPRPGMLANVKYTFDWLDIAASFVSIYTAYVMAHVLTKRNTNAGFGN